MASKAIGFLNFKFGADLSGFERAMNKTQKKLKKFGKSVEKTGKNMTMGLTLPILGMGAAALKFGSDLQETDSKFKQVFISIQKEAEETAKVFEESFGLSEVAAKQLLSDTGDLLVGFGFTEKSALELSKQVNELAVDLASFTNFEGGAEGASKALTKALVGETESSKALGIVIRQGTKEYKDRTEEIMKEQGVSILQAKALNNLEIATKQSQKAIGDFSRTSGDFANQMRIVKGDLVDVAAEMGARLIPFAQAAIEKLKGLIKWFEGLSESTKDNIVKWGLILAAIGPVLIIIGKMSIGIGALIRVFSKLGTFLVANPYVLLAAAIAGVAYVVYDLVSALTSQIDVQQEIENLNTEAKKSIAGELVNIDLLTAAIKDENSSLDDKLTALNTLKQTYPGYYDAIDETTLSTQNLNAATETLKENLMQVAMLTAHENKLTEIASKMLDLETSSDIDLSTNIGANLLTSSLGPLYTILADVTGVQDDLKTKLQENIDTKEYEQLEILFEEITGKTLVLQKEVNKTNKEFSKLKHDPIETLIISTEDLKKETEELTESTKEYSDALEDNIILGDDQFQQYSLAEDQFKGMVTWTTRLTDAQKLASTGFQMFGDILTSSLDSALDNQENFFKSFLKNIKRAIRSLLVQLAVMTLIQAIMPGSMGGMGKGAFKLSNIKSNLMGLMSIPMAEGGLVTGPTTALIGEGPGTTAANPEVVAPLDKLKSMIGGGNQHITVTGKLIGNDIFLSNAITGVNRLRTT